MKSLYSLPLLAFVMLAGCQTPPKQPKEFNDALDKAIEESSQEKKITPLTKVPSSVQRELMERSVSKARQGLLSEKRLEIAAKDVEAKAFFAAIADGSMFSIAVHPDVTGSITLNLTDVTLTEALSVVRDVYGFEMHRDENVIQIFPAGIRTETIVLDYLFIKRFGQSNTSINSGGVSDNDPNSGSSSSRGNRNNNSRSTANNNSNNSSNGRDNSNNKNSSGINLYTENESNFWKELKTTLTALVGTEKGRSVIVSPQAGLVTIKAFPNEIAEVKSFLEDTQKRLHRQVIIEAKIMEVTLNDDYQQGVKWEEVLGSIGSTDFTFSTSGNLAGNVIANTIGGATSLSFSGTDFSGVIDLLQTQGNVQTLSSPRITATNNQKAVIKVGEDEYFVTEVSSTTTTGTSTTVTPEIKLTPFFSGIALDVTPQIDQDGDVILHVHPSVTLTDEQTKRITLADQDIVLPLAQSRVRESDTVIRAKSGEIVVIGGLIETTNVDIESKTPILGDVPWLGEIFKSKSQTTKKKELVILLKPIVVGQDTWKNQMLDARALLKEWFPDDEEAQKSNDN